MRFFAFILFFLFYSTSYSQDSISKKIDAKEITITTDKSSIDKYTFKSKTKTGPSIFLNFESPVFLKIASPGMLVSPSIRGGNASQTLITWDLVPLNSAMLGQSDLSLYNLSFINAQLTTLNIPNINLGNLNGQINFTTQLNDTFKWKLQLASSTISNLTLGAGLMFKIKRISNMIFLNVQNNNNRFYYIDDINYTNKTKIKQIGAQFKQLSFYSTSKFKLFKLPVSLDVWYNYSKRNLIPTILANNFKETQQDSSLRLQINSFYAFNTSSFIKVKIAAMHEALNYQNKQILINSNNKINTFFSLVNFTHNFNNKSNINIDFLGNSVAAFSNNYNTNPKQNTFAISATYFTYYKVLSMRLNIKQAHVNSSFLLPVGNAFIDFKITKNLNFFLNTGYNIRVPTLNDLYWQQSGNLNLLPENSKFLENGISFVSPKFNFKFLPYYKLVNNWIQWTPSASALWTPKNVKQVQQYGYEFFAEHNLRFGKFNFIINTIVTYTKSISTKTNSVDDASLNKQLIYTPIWQFKNSLTLVYKNKYLFTLFHQFTDWRATTSDNFNYLNGFNVFNLQCGTHYNLKNARIDLNIGIDNLFNSNYAVIAYRPQPLRNANISISLTKK